MSEETYILEAYKIEYKFLNNAAAYMVIVPEVLLQPLLNYLFASGVTHSRPTRQRGEALYTIYIAGDGSVAKSVEDFVNELSRDLRARGANVKYVGSVDALDEGTKLDMAYRGVRQYLYKGLELRRGSGQKLYDPSNAVKRYGMLDVYRAYVTGSDIVNGFGYLFIDAARKLEFTATLKDLEVHSKEDVEGVQWVKIKGSTTSFYIKQFNAKNVGNAADLARQTLEYIAETRNIPINIEKLSFDEDDIVALTPRSIRLLQELRARGYTVSSGGDDYVLLPKVVLVPVASMDNIARLLHTSINLRIDPTSRHKEITELVQKLSKGIDIGAMHVSIDPEPLKIAVEKVPLDKLYIDISSSKDRDVKSVAFSWNPYHLLKSVANMLTIYILYVKGDRRSYAIADSVRAQLYENLGVEAQTLALDTKKVDSIAQHVAEMVRDMNVIGVVLVIGPSSVSDYEDRRLREAVERAFRFRGLFCWYISISSRGRKGGSGKKQDVSRLILNKLRVVMKELAIRLSLFPHKLLPLELVVGSGKEVVNVVGAADATVVGLEKGWLRIGEALLIMNIAEDRPVLETDAETSMQGEDAVLAKLVRKALSYANGSRIVMYVNRARPEALLNYMDEAEAREVLSKVIIVGATKTHTYPRMLKDFGNNFANPEITAYHHLNTKEISNINAVTSKYLAITTSAWGESFEGGLTVKPTLLTIVTNKEIANQQNIENILRYTITLCILNNTSTWIHSLPWPLHRVDKILKTAHRLTQTQNEIIATLKNKEIAKVL